MRLRLTPRTTEFYDLFTRAGENALEAARHAETRFREYPNSSVTQADVKAIETGRDHPRADPPPEHAVRDPVRPRGHLRVRDRDRRRRRLHRGGERPARALRVEAATKHAVEQCRILVQAVEQLAIAIQRLKGLRGVQDALVELKRLEDAGDRVVHDAIAALFRDDRIDPLIVIRWKDIYEGLEKALDAAERAANVIANIVVKNA